MNKNNWGAVLKNWSVDREGCSLTCKSAAVSAAVCQANGLVVIRTALVSIMVTFIEI